VLTALGGKQSGIKSARLATIEVLHLGEVELGNGVFR
jgi:hypothetical protein